MDEDDDSRIWDDDSWEDNEPIGSCDNCEQDLFEDDAYEVDGWILCSQCAWSFLGGDDE